MTTSPTYVVTGGAGFVGSNLAATLQHRFPDAHVIVIDTFRTGSFDNLVEACERIAGAPFAGSVLAADFREEVIGLIHAEPKPRAVFHLAAVTDTTLTNQREMIDANASWGFEELLRACSLTEVPLVYASSAATYGSPPESERRQPFPEDSAGLPNNVYGFSKWLMECTHRRLAAARAADGKPPAHIVGLRYFNVFGPGEESKGHMASMPRQLTLQMLAGRSPRIFTDGEQARDQIYIDDVVVCTIAAAGIAGRRDPVPGIYNLGSGHATTFNEIVDAIRGALDIPESDLRTEYFDMPRSVRAFYQDFTCADMTAAATGLGFRPAHDPRRAVADYAAYLRDRAQPSEIKH